MKVLVTGAKGFSARHLTRYLAPFPDIELFLAGRGPSSSKNYFEGDLSHAGVAEKMLREVVPDQIYHLAGSFSNDYFTDYSANVLTTKNLLDALLGLRLQRSCRVLLVGSSAEYGYVTADENPVQESQPLRPVGIYGLTKVFQTHLMRYYGTVHQLDLVMARPFNLIGKGMSNRLFVGRVYEQIEDYQKGRIPRITIGSLADERDYLGVEDAVRFYKVIMEKGISGEIYHVGSGKPVKMSELLSRILNENGLTMEIVEEKDGFSPSPGSVPQIFANVEKISKIMDPGAP